MRLVVFEPDMAPNLGALLRVAACFGAAVDVIEPCGFPFSEKSLRRVAMDYAAMVETAHHDSWRAYRAKPHEGRLILLTTKATRSLYETELALSDRVMVGRESAGVPDAVAAEADAQARIPLAAGARSLNVAVAAAVALAEARRRLGGVS